MNRIIIIVVLSFISYGSIINIAYGQIIPTLEESLSYNHLVINSKYSYLDRYFLNEQVSNYYCNGFTRANRRLGVQVNYNFIGGIIVYAHINSKVLCKRIK